MFIVALNLNMKNASHFDKRAPRRVFHVQVPDSLVGHGLLGTVNASQLESLFLSSGITRVVSGTTVASGSSNTGRTIT